MINNNNNQSPITNQQPTTSNRQSRMATYEVSDVKCATVNPLKTPLLKCLLILINRPINKSRQKNVDHHYSPSLRRQQLRGNPLGGNTCPVKVCALRGNSRSLGSHATQQLASGYSTQYGDVSHYELRTYEASQLHCIDIQKPAALRSQTEYFVCILL